MPRKSRRPVQLRAPAIDRRNRFRLLHHFRRKAVRQVVLADDDLDVDAEIVRDGPGSRSRGRPARSPSSGNSSSSTLTIMPSRSSTDCDFDAASPRCGPPARPAGGNLHAFGNLDPLLDALVVRHHVLPAACRCGIRPPRWDARACRTLTISPSARPSGFDARDAHHHAVAVHGLFRRIRRDEDVALRCLRWAGRKSGSRSRRGAC